MSRTLAGEPHAATAPKPLLIELGDDRQSVVFPAVGITGPVAQGFQFAKHRHGGRTSQRLFQFFEGGNLLSLQEGAEEMGVKTHVI